MEKGENKMAKNNQDRFVKVLTEGSSFSTVRTLFVDRETGVNYLVIKDGYGTGVTPLIDADGKPVVTILP